MCGIIGYIGSREAVPLLLDGLKRLEYRGYDSAGLAVLRDAKIDLRRSVGKLTNLEKAVNGAGLHGTVGIGHTRWATHGKPSEQNAHPHRSGPLVLVHNGIIENYAALKARLHQEGYRFESATDTEVMAHLVARTLKVGRGLEEAVRAAIKEVRGSYAIAVLCEVEPQTIIAARSGCPLVVGMSEHGAFAASDVTAILAHTRDVVFLEDDELAVLSTNALVVKDARGDPDRVGRGRRGKRRLPALHAEGDPRTAADDPGHDARALHLRARGGGPARHRIDAGPVRRCATHLDRRLRDLLACRAGGEVPDRGNGAGAGPGGHRLGVPLPQPLDRA